MATTQTTETASYSTLNPLPVATLYPQPTYPNAWEREARAAKVAKLVAVALDAGLTAAGSLAMEVADWDTLAFAAGTRRPSPESRRQVIATLTAHEVDNVGGIMANIDPDPLEAS